MSHSDIERRLNASEAEDAAGIDLAYELDRLRAIERRWQAMVKHSWRIVQYGPWFVVLPVAGDSVGDGVSAEAAVDDAIERVERLKHP